MDIFSTLFAGPDPLISAAFEGDHLEVRRLLSKSVAHVNMVGEFLGRRGPPLLFAAAADHPHVVELLLKRGAKINQPDQDGSSPLCAAAECGNHRVVELLPGAAAD